MPDNADKPPPQEKAQPTPAPSPGPSTAQVVAWELLGLGLLLAVAVLVLGGLLIAITGKQEAIETERQQAEASSMEPAVPVLVSLTRPETVVDAVHLPGRIEARKRVQVPCEATGQVIETDATPVADGSMIKAGAPILHIDPESYQITLQQAEAALALAKQTHDRTVSLLEKGVRTPADLDRDRSQLRQSQAAVDAARLNLKNCTVYSPITGYIDDVAPETGEFVRSGDMAATVLALNPAKVEIGIPETDINAVRSIQEGGEEVELHVISILDEERKPLQVSGRCTYLSLEPMQQAYVYRMRLEVPNKDLRLRPGMFVEAKVVREVRTNAIVVPLFAVLAHGDTHTVYVAETTTNVEGAQVVVARRKTVKLGVMLGERVEILEGLKANEKLIVMGQRQVENGATIRIVRTVESTAEDGR